MVKTKAEFAPGDFIVYPTHGVGRIIGIEEQEISGMELTLYVIKFVQEKKGGVNEVKCSFCSFFLTLLRFIKTSSL